MFEKSRFVVDGYGFYFYLRPIVSGNRVYLGKYQVIAFIIAMRMIRLEYFGHNRRISVLGFGGGEHVIIMKIIKIVTHLRVDEVEEELGLDVTKQEESECGEDLGV